MEAQAQDRLRDDDVLLKFEFKSPINPIMTNYKLDKQQWMLPD